MGTCFSNGNSEVSRFGSYHELEWTQFTYLLLAPMLLAHMWGDILL